MAYARPFYDYEIDAHPDRDRIEATLTERLDAKEEEMEAAIEEAEKARDEAWEADIRAAQEERDNAESVRQTAEAEAQHFYSILSELGVALVQGKARDLSRALERLGKTLVDQGELSPVDAAELDGVAEWLLGSEQEAA